MIGYFTRWRQSYQALISCISFSLTQIRRVIKIVFHGATIRANSDNFLWRHWICHHDCPSNTRSQQRILRRCSRLTWCVGCFVATDTSTEYNASFFSTEVNSTLKTEAVCFSEMLSPKYRFFTAAKTSNVKSDVNVQTSKGHRVQRYEGAEVVEENLQALLWSILGVSFQAGVCKRRSGKTSKQTAESILRLH
jgi:hypothetical protein